MIVTRVTVVTEVTKGGYEVNEEKQQSKTRRHILITDENYRAVKVEAAENDLEYWQVIDVALRQYFEWRVKNE